ncbi:hypothetical protein H8356DRAFT_1672859 [Neocallimastix lanati (nom. inval.)]|uniref:ER membrane protein complex subunit 6 n=1 Tax=Neocallimastix californiae TaxID=1754190 RepID=A0A1Y2BCT0_9FUNG|nr:hypothetical protein H8356DRAFT_1672859 [Neocallimastix sp. JGI-2020a]ORY32648.1 hypothetical protein LY90DRAFT_673479 [Neocallimastix californiae]|eukprot:ORY32648.1 hypothetical protein LY90DRAFT_673479 [Neocallimastix californiae]
MENFMKFEKLNVKTMVENGQTAQAIRIIMSIFGGLACGIMGYTGFNGFYFYFALNAVICLFLLIKAQFQYSKYFRGAMDFFLGDIYSNLLCFIMFWCLGYALINVYE